MLLDPHRSLAETLQDALTLAYQNNPDLQAARANLKAQDETYVQARSGFGPQIALDLAGTYSDAQVRTLGGARINSETNTGQAALTLDQPLFTGGRTSADVKRTLSEIEAARERLRAVESSIMLETIRAYSNVRRDEQALAIRRGNLEAYSNQVTEVTARIQQGELTQTDLAQSQLLLETERSQLNNAQAQLQSSRAAYRAVVGENPGSLAAESALPNLPASLEEAIIAGRGSSPALREAQALEDASRSAVARAHAEFLPSISLNASLGYTGELAPLDRRDYDRGVTGGITVRQPLFTGGLRSSLVRQARAQMDVRHSLTASGDRAMEQDVTDSWNAMTAAINNRVAAEAAVVAARLALQGSEIEYRADYRSTFEVLNARERLSAAELFLVTTEQDRFLSEANLLATIGRLEGPALVPNLPPYDARAGFRAIRNRGVLPTDLVGQLLDRPVAGALTPK